MSENIDRCLSQACHIHLQHAGMQAISKPDSNILANIAESRTLGGLKEPYGGLWPKLVLQSLSNYSRAVYPLPLPHESRLPARLQDLAGT